jgi:hypothetical protein
MTWAIWAKGANMKRPMRFCVPAPSPEAACALVLGCLKRGFIIDCAPLSELMGVRQ